MYQPPHFREDDLAVQHALIKAHPLGLLVTFGSDGLEANPIPFVLEASASSLGTLKAHLSRANPQWRNFDPAQEALVVFQGPETYITPSWYAAKREHGKVVPTWNYVVVQARGRLRAIDDTAWLRAFVGRLTERFEAERTAATAVPPAWRVGDAPEDFLQTMLGAIVGIEIELGTLIGKYKLSQNRGAADRQGALAGVQALAEARGDAATQALYAAMAAAGKT
jgi:transcriptional regulator